MKTILWPLRTATAKAVPNDDTRVLVAKDAEVQAE
jgi:hypothetical protein